MPSVVVLEAVGTPSLMTTELKATLADHAAGHYRVLINLSDELLAVALDHELPGLNEKLYERPPQAFWPALGTRRWTCHPEPSRLEPKRAVRLSLGHPSTTVLRKYG